MSPFWPFATPEEFDQHWELAAKSFAYHNSAHALFQAAIDARPENQPAAIAQRVQAINESNRRACRT